MCVHSGWSPQQVSNLLLYCFTALLLLRDSTEQQLLLMHAPLSYQCMRPYATDA